MFVSEKHRGSWACSVIAAVVIGAVGGCSDVPGFGDGGESKQTTDAAVVDTAGSSGGTSGASNDSGRSSGNEDTGPLVCQPDCEVWQICTDGVCQNKVCSKDTECNAAGGPPAGVKPHYCYKGKCALFQCGKDEDCPKDQLCNDKTYVCYEKKTGCAIDSDCIDSNLCTSDTCDTKTGKCAHKKLPNCCNADLDCDDGSDCTTDKCNTTTSSCENTPKDKCCVEDANCADSSPCTVDTCDKASGQCKFTKKASCCENDGQCDDKIDATADSCVKGSCVHYGGGPKTCTKKSDCTENGCVIASCVGGMCSHTSTSKTNGCCKSDAACQSGFKACQKQACNVMVCQTTKVTGNGDWHWFGFDDSSISGWTASNENKSAGWGHYTAQKVSGAGSLRYGVPNKKSWSAGFPNKGHVTSKPIPIPTGGKLDFFIHFDGEPGAGVHLFGLKVIEGGKETDVWTKNKDLKGNTGGGWKQFGVDLATWSGKTVQLRWWFDVAVKFPKEDGHGLAIDDMVVSGKCD